MYDPWESEELPKLSWWRRSEVRSGAGGSLALLVGFVAGWGAAALSPGVAVEPLAPALHPLSEKARMLRNEIAPEASAQVDETPLADVSPGATGPAPQGIVAQ